MGQVLEDLKAEMWSLQIYKWFTLKTEIHYFLIWRDFKTLGIVYV